MKAIEINTKTDKNGHLKIGYNLNKAEKEVRVLILYNEDYSDLDDEKMWIDTISGNPAFDFVNDPDEDIYSLKDGESIDG